MKIGHGINGINFKRKRKFLRKKSVYRLKYVIFQSNGPKTWERWKVNIMHLTWLLT